MSEETKKTDLKWHEFHQRKYPIYVQWGVQSNSKLEELRDEQARAENKGMCCLDGRKNRMTKEEARKRAEEWAFDYANEAHGEECVKSDGNEPEWQGCYDDCLRSYMQCYAEMTEGKPDAYLALDNNNNKVTIGLSYESTEERMTGIRYQDFNRYEDYVAQRERSAVELWDLGWRIKPVKLLAIEEDKKND